MGAGAPPRLPGAGGKAPCVPREAGQGAGAGGPIRPEVRVMEPPPLDQLEPTPTERPGFAAVLSGLDDVACFRRPWRLQSWAAVGFGLLDCGGGFALGDAATLSSVASMAIVFVPFLWLGLMLSVDCARFGSRRRKLWWTLGSWLVLFAVAGGLAMAVTLEDGAEHVESQEAADAAQLDAARQGR
jgi:hypothetical protein